MEKGDIPLIKFNGKNYTSWAFQFQVYLKGNEMWGHIDELDPKPTDDKTDSQDPKDPKSTYDKKDEISVAKKEIKDAQIMSWILGSVDSQFIIHLHPYKTAQAMWDYLKQIYYQENSAWRF